MDETNTSSPPSKRLKLDTNANIDDIDDNIHDIDDNIDDNIDPTIIINDNENKNKSIQQQQNEFSDDLPDLSKKDNGDKGESEDENDDEHNTESDEEEVRDIIIPEKFHTNKLSNFGMY